MQINEEMIDRLAHLARLEFNNADKQEMIADLSRMLDFVETLNEVDTEGVEPLVYMTDHTNDFRPDEVIHSISKEEALQNAPKKDSDYFRVAKVIENK